MFTQNTTYSADTQRPAIRAHNIARLNQGATQSKPAIKLSNRETLEKRAEARNAMAMAEAKAMAPYCEPVEFNPDTNVFGFQKRGQANVVHRVNFNTGECDCILQQAVSRLNGELIAERSDVQVMAKCWFVLGLMEAQKPNCFMDAPIVADPFRELFLNEVAL